MKKISSIDAKETSPKRSIPMPVVRGDPPTSEPVTDAVNCARLELSPPKALAVLEPAAPPGIVPVRRVRFGYFNPEAREVHLLGSFNGWDPRATPLRRDSLGDWSAEIELPRGEHRYRFFVDGEWRDDPAAQQTAQNPFGGFDAVMVVV